MGRDVAVAVTEQDLAGLYRHPGRGAGTAEPRRRPAVDPGQPAGAARTRDRARVRALRAGKERCGVDVVVRGGATAISSRTSRSFRYCAATSALATPSCRSGPAGWRASEALRPSGQTLISGRYDSGTKAVSSPRLSSTALHDGRSAMNRRLFTDFCPDPSEPPSAVSPYVSPQPRRCFREIC